ncbi:SHOCT domain-containing protein [Nocardiopsis suaedae]|uniref:SHOCT domain-containing protein n=1 Tax=Nocardiopsis suaedae TaxID=3018444 RepID=A0ABT4TGD3_9ACTN|nr:SHOCT domain-containing protein [Nocardiopsis suaedae]MDA2803777.1 SHOCT domain-containing protein [Nocardiopsis suaedae]
MNTITFVSAAAAAHGPPWAGSPPPFVPFFGVAMFLLLLLLTALAVFLLMRAKGHRPPWAHTAPEPPETAARRVLAERFAKGDINVEEFMERASALNWNPGQDPKKGRA